MEKAELKWQTFVVGFLVTGLSIDGFMGIFLYVLPQVTRKCEVNNAKLRAK